MTDIRTDRLVAELNRLATSDNPNLRDVNRRIKTIITQLHMHRVLLEEVSSKRSNSSPDQLPLPLFATVRSSTSLL